MKYVISTWNSISSPALDDMINEFLRENAVEIVSISHSSTYDPNNKCIEYSTSLLYMFSNNGDKK